MIADFDFSVRLMVILFEHGYFWQLVIASALLIGVWRMPEIIRALKERRD